MFRFILSIVSLIIFSNLAFGQNKEVNVKIETKYGVMLFKLYNETPLHKDNFVKLIKKGHYDSLLFHRIIQSFVVQGGDPTSKYAKKDSLLGEGDVGYTVPAEFNPQLFHKKGALAMAREGDDVNPKKASSGCQFYIVHGKPRNDTDMIKAAYRNNKSLIQPLEDSIRKLDTVAFSKWSPYEKHKRLSNLVKGNKNYYQISAAQLKVYQSLGGTPHLDNNYTVFGEMIAGIEVLDKLAAANTDKNDRPIEDIRMKITIVEKNTHARKNRKNIKRN
jgi:peptidylprolyl isomerase